MWGDECDSDPASDIAAARDGMERIPVVVREAVEVRTGLPGTLWGVGEEWNATACGFCCEPADVMVILEDGRYAVMLCEDCRADDSVGPDDVPPEHLLLVVTSSMN